MLAPVDFFDFDLQVSAVETDKSLSAQKGLCLFPDVVVVIILVEIPRFGCNTFVKGRLQVRDPFNFSEPSILSYIFNVFWWWA